MCQEAARMVLKFEHNWAVEYNWNKIKHTLRETIIDNTSVITNPQENLQSCKTPSIECNNNNFENDFLVLKNIMFWIQIVINDYKNLVDNNYFCNTSIESPSVLPNYLKEIYYNIKYNTAIPSFTHVERHFKTGGQLLNKRRESMLINILR